VKPLFWVGMLCLAAGVAPVLSVSLAAWLGSISECREPIAGMAQCSLRGLEIGPVIARLSVFGLITLLTWPFGVAGLVLMTLWAILRGRPRPGTD